MDCHGDLFFTDGMLNFCRSKMNTDCLPKADGKKAILFCTCAFWKDSTFKILTKELVSKGYDTILSVSKKGLKPDKPADFSGSIGEIRKVI